MIKIASSVKLSFMFPADWVTAFEYYSDLPRSISHLAHIDIVPSDVNSEDEFRLWYHTVELGRYHIHVFCDIRMEYLRDQKIIRMIPIKNFPPVETKVTVNSTTTRGYYRSEGKFYDAGDQARIEYMFELQASPPKPKGMRLVPGKIVDKVTQNITKNRMSEIASDFISNSVSAYPEWVMQEGVS